MDKATPATDVQRRKRRTIILLCLIVVPLFLFGLNWLGVSREFPKSWSIPFLDWLDVVIDWVVNNLYFIIGPIKQGLKSVLDSLRDLLLRLPWWFIVTAVFSLVAKIVNAQMATFSVIALFFMGLVGMWEATMTTLSLMTVSVGLSVILAIPLGIIASFNDTFDAIIRPLLDIMQTMPTYVYLIPIIVLFGVGEVPGLVATVIYALPPGIRLTNLGIRQVSPDVLEVAKSYGSTTLQTLFKVQLPLAVPSIMMGINQIIMMALAMVVIAALVGTGGLGYEVYKGVERLQLGRSVESGLGILFLAIILDRLSQGLIHANERPIAQRGRFSEILSKGISPLLGLLNKRIEPTRRHQLFFVRHGFSIIGAIAILVLLMLQIFVINDVPDFPWKYSLREEVHKAIIWASINLAFITDKISDTLFLILDSVETFLHWLPWTVILAAVGCLAGIIGGWRIAMLSITAFLFIGFQGASAFPPKSMWDLTMDTLAMVIVSTFLSVIIGVLLGILAARSDTIQRFLRPIMDGMQVIPTFVYLVPMVMLFGLGNVSAVMATVIYSFPPCARLTELGIRQVTPITVEAAKSFGSTPIQTLIKVQLPLAIPSIMQGINQAIMMVLSMVIIAALIGGGGLGLEILRAKSFIWIGRGVEAGLDIVFIAIIIDRITQNWVNRRKKALMFKRSQ